VELVEQLEGAVGPVLEASKVLRAWADQVVLVVMVVKVEMVVAVVVGHQLESPVLTTNSLFEIR
jgi:hypothetical protein